MAGLGTTALMAAAVMTAYTARPETIPCLAGPEMIPSTVELGTTPRTAVQGMMYSLCKTGRSIQFTTALTLIMRSRTAMTFTFLKGEETQSTGDVSKTIGIGSENNC